MICALLVLFGMVGCASILPGGSAEAAERPQRQGRVEAARGMDLYEVVFTAVNDQKPSETEMKTILVVLENRLVAGGITSYELEPDAAYGRVTVRFAVGEGTDPEPLVLELEAQGRLTFREGCEVDSTTGLPVGVSETVLLDNNDIAQAEVKYGPLGPSAVEHYVELTFTADGAGKFAEATASIAEKQESISIWMDDTLISNPRVNESITGGVAIIAGNFTAESSRALADIINNKALPCALRAESLEPL